MQTPSVQSRIEEALRVVAEVEAVVEVQGDIVRLSGVVESPEQRLAAEDVVGTVVPGMTIDNGLEIEDVGLEPGASFTDQVLLHDPTAAPGATGGQDETAVDEGDEVYVPPTDPVIVTNEHGDAVIAGGFGLSSTDSVEVERSSDGTLGDEAIEDAVRRELTEDAATTGLGIRVMVRQGRAHLSGSVSEVQDAENAEEVASRVPGVVEVVDETEIAA